MPGTITLEAEVTNISKHCFWLLLGNEELAVSFNDFPWFKNATVEQLTDINGRVPIICTGPSWTLIYPFNRFAIRLLSRWFLKLESIR